MVKQWYIFLALVPVTMLVHASQSDLELGSITISSPYKDCIEFIEQKDPAFAFVSKDPDGQYLSLARTVNQDSAELVFSSVNLPFSPCALKVCPKDGEMVTFNSSSNNVDNQVTRLTFVDKALTSIRTVLCAKQLVGLWYKDVDTLIGCCKTPGCDLVYSEIYDVRTNIWSRLLLPGSFNKFFYSQGLLIGLNSTKGCIQVHDISSKTIVDRGYHNVGGGVKDIMVDPENREELLITYHNTSPSTANTYSISKKEWVNSFSCSAPIKDVYFRESKILFSNGIHIYNVNKKGSCVPEKLSILGNVMRLNRSHMLIGSMLNNENGSRMLVKVNSINDLE